MSTTVCVWGGWVIWVEALYEWSVRSFGASGLRELLIVHQRRCPAAFWEPETPALCRRVKVWKRGPTIPWCRASHISAPVFVVLAMKMRITPQAKHVKTEYYITYLSAARAVCLLFETQMFYIQCMWERPVLSMHVSDIHTCSLFAVYSFISRRWRCFIVVRVFK